MVREAPDIHDDVVSFERGTITLQAYPAYQRSLGGDRAHLASATVGVGYFVRNNLSFSLEVTGYGVDQPGDDAVAASAAVVMRHHFLRRPRSTLFIDIGQGIFYGSNEVPPGGTHLNFAFRAGPGFSYQLREGIHLIAGARYFHLSNARRRGAERNPSINGIEGYVGMMWELR